MSIIIFYSKNEKSICSVVREIEFGKNEILWHITNSYMKGDIIQFDLRDRIDSRDGDKILSEEEYEEWKKENIELFI